MSTLRPITSPPGTRRPSQVSGIIICLVFLLIGLVVLGAVYVPWLVNVVRAAGWPETPCRILSSTVERSSGGEGRRYRVAVRFEYEADGRTHQSERYGFWSRYSDGRGSKQEIVDRLARGTRTVCYVDPSDPSRAVLDRGLSLEFVMAFIPLVFALLGGAGLVSLFRIDPGRTSWKRRAPPESRIRLRSGPTGGVGSLIAVGVFAIFWNGIILVVLGDRLTSFDARQVLHWIAVIFSVPFVLVGLFLLAVTASVFFDLFRPRTRLEVPKSPIPLGGTLPVGWRTAAGNGRGKGFRIVLEGIEIAEGSGKSRRTREEIFAAIPVADSEKGDELRHGSARIQVPARAMHSVDAGNSGIVWAVRLYRRFGRREAVVEQETITVRPAPVSSRAAR